MVHKSPGRRPRTTALAAAAIFLLVPLATACGDDNGDTTTESSPTPTAIAPTTARPTGTASADAPADPEAARAEIEKNWADFFNPDTPADDRVALLENGEQLRPVLTAFAANPQAQETTAKVTDVTFESATRAGVTYDLMVGSATPLPASKGTSVLQDDVWKVSQNTLCALVKLSGDAVPDVPGC
ncbi:hypothetical protein [Streptomyces sp. MUM 203J]|uniref:hypothetical protein n=1 Tax=Streptomyces sp. MUM 203J TaxID=2791990 RepID=UPI001F03A71F|nr:hypothetical protein [Streptomyces sp. MUM 203J]